jgi:2,3-dihydroxyphenylpropionate 1,2-dioxygenase
MPGGAILGGAFLPHAPQFFTRPETEDAENVARVENVAAMIGERLAALRPDVWVTISNDHTQQFYLHCAPPFALHVGSEAKGSFAGREFRYDIASEVSFALLRELYVQGFDPAFSSTAEVDYALGIPLTHLHASGPILPVFVNAYLPPQPTMPRCYAFGKAMAAALGVLGVSAVVMASGGMSHFPGTDRYARPDTGFDKALLESIRRGNLQTLAGLDERQLDESGNIELRCWAVAAGMLGERVPDVLEFNPSWHHNYCSVGFWQPQRAAAAPHYPATKPEVVALTRALHGLAHDASAREDYRRDAASFARANGLPAIHAKLLCAADFDGMVALGVHPLVSFLARMQLEREKAAKH